MKLVDSSGGIKVLMHPLCRRRGTETIETRLVAEWRGNSDHLRIGDDHDLSYDDVRLLVRHLEAWLATGSLALPAEPTKAEAMGNELGRLVDIGQVIEAARSRMTLDQWKAMEATLLVLKPGENR